MEFEYTDAGVSNTYKSLFSGESMAVSEGCEAPMGVTTVPVTSCDPSTATPAATPQPWTARTWGTWTSL